MLLAVGKGAEVVEVPKVKELKVWTQIIPFTHQNQECLKDAGPWF